MLYVILFQGVFKEERVTDITLLEFLSYGPQKEAGKVSQMVIFSDSKSIKCMWMFC